jgi:hypothetical protein
LEDESHGTLAVQDDDDEDGDESNTVGGNDNEDMDGPVPNSSTEGEIPPPPPIHDPFGKFTPVTITYPTIASCFLTTTISDFPMMSSNSSPSSSPSMSPASDDLTDKFLRERLVVLMAESSLPPTPSVAPPPAPMGWWTVAFSSQPLEFSNPTAGFQGGSLPQVHSSPRVSLGDVTPHAVDPCNVPLRVKLVGKQSLSRNAELSIFDILNIFHWW